MSTLDEIRTRLAAVPLQPGVYLWKDADGTVIYVGKAKQLRARMKQYVLGQDERAKIPLMLEQIADFDYIVTENEHESLVLEKNLIRQYHPYFNADFKDDKSYPFIAITDGDMFPAIKYTREKHRRDTVYFGPYTDSRAARRLVEITRKVVPICSAGCTQWRRMKRIIDSEGPGAYDFDAEKPCFDCHVGLGPGACCGQIDSATYAESVKRVKRFLHGNHAEFVASLREEMDAAATALDFERAQRCKDRIETIEGIDDRQHAVLDKNLDADVIGVFREETIAGVHVLVVREGRILNSNEFVLDRGADVPDDDLLHNFLLRYYDATTQIPHEVICERIPEDEDVMREWLTKKLDSPHGARLKFVAPQRGAKHDLLEMAQRNARHTLLRYKMRTNYEDKRINEALLQLESALALDRPPLRIECFDISTIHGSYTVASMVVFTDGRPDKNQYRRFKIKTPLDEADDFASMQEVMARRYAPERMADSRFGRKPDLIILDGGIPQLNASLAMFREMGIDDIAMCGLAKRDEEIFVPWQAAAPIVLPGGSSSLYLVKRIRDEAHRFAITFHRELRGKGMTASVLDDVVGMGPVRKKAVLKHFGGFRKLREASLDDIMAASILPDDVAKEMFSVLRQYTETHRSGNADSIGAGREGNHDDV